MGDSEPTGVPILATQHLVVAGGVRKDDLNIYTGCTLVETFREQSATVYALTLAGRMKPESGEIWLAGELASSSQLFRNIAYAGTPEIDHLERQVSVRAVVREQLAWAGPWYGRVPRNILDDKRYTNWSELIGLEVLPSAAIAQLSPLERFKLRIVLALIARPQAMVLIVDDIDQLRSMELRAQLLDALREVSSCVPVVAMSVNPEEIQ